MKRIERGVLLFLVLVLALSAGISYLALNQASKTSNNAVQKMAVALVNEDEGTEFNGNHYEFGSEFINSIEKDAQHEWYIVSRGVAESGLERNVYNMMIVIPNDFTDKALSIDSASPDQVLLNYKINATDNNKVKAEAENTASSILGDFYRRIIDVYFASIIGNLQDAQDNISSIVEKEQNYTYMYNNTINRPLSNYTSQFKAVQSDTEISKASFDGLQDILKEFESNLGEGVKTTQTYQDSFMNLAEKQAANGLLAKDLSNLLSDLDSGMNSEDALQQLDHLQAANKAINNQFILKNEEQNTATIISKSVAIQTYLHSTKEKMGRIDTKLTDTLASDMQKTLADKLQKSIRSSSGEEQDVYLNMIFAKPDNNAKKSLERQINKLPSLNLDDLDGLNIAEGTYNQLKNVIAVTNKYTREFGFIPERPTDSIPLADQVDQILSDLVETGVNVTDSVTLPANKKTGQELTLNVPEEYEVNQVLLTLPDEQEMDYTTSYSENKKITLPATEEGKFTIKLKLHLKDKSSQVDVFQPITWSWNIVQKDVTDVDKPELPSEPEPEPEIPGNPDIADPTDPTDKDTAPSVDTDDPVLPVQVLNITNSSENINSGEMKASDDEQNVSVEKDSDSTEGNNQDQDPLDPEEENNGEDDQSDEEPQEEVPSENPSNEMPGDSQENGNNDKEEQPKKLKVINNTINHQVMSPLINDSTSILFNAASDTISNYQRMLMLYDIYFGINMFNPDLVDQLSQTKLSDLTTPDSLYYLFNKQDIVEVIANYLAEQITEEVRIEAENLQTDIDTYIAMVNQAVQDSETMSNLINQTTDQANVLNTNLAESLNDVTSWREASLNLQGEQTKILNNEDEVQSVVVELDGQFSSLLAASQSLAEQSKGNLNTADGVYQTFEAIDNQAAKIQTSGSDIVEDAADLSENLTEKLVEDQTFAENFAGVLANSRVGERQNENLFSFLSNPVQTKNDGVIVAGNKFTPYFIVLICFIVCLFTAYVISTNERKRVQKDTFEEERSMVRNNGPITIVTTSIGVIEGIVIGLLSGYLLQMGQDEFLLWTGTITLIMLAMLLVATYLLRQLKMVGMFILLIILSLYLFLTEALGLHLEKVSLAAKLRTFSPLQYIEKLLMEFGNGLGGNQSIIYGCLALIVISIAGHLFVLNRFAKSKEVDDEGVSETI